MRRKTAFLRISKALSVAVTSVLPANGNVGYGGDSVIYGSDNVIYA